jgi:hypothetical protein
VDAPFAESFDLGKVSFPAIDRRLVELEIARVHDQSGW